MSPSLSTGGPLALLSPSIKKPDFTSFPSRGTSLSLLVETPICLGSPPLPVETTRISTKLPVKNHPASVTVLVDSSPSSRPPLQLQALLHTHRTLSRSAMLSRRSRFLIKATSPPWGHTFSSSVPDMSELGGVRPCSSARPCESASSTLPKKGGLQTQKSIEEPSLSAATSAASLRVSADTTEGKREEENSVCQCNPDCTVWNSSTRTPTPILQCFER